MYLELIWTIALASLVYIIVNYLFHLSVLKAKEFTRDFPPGPTPLPIFGNLHLLGKQPHVAIKELSKKYGDVVSISLGSKKVVVLNAIEPAREMLIQKGADFAGQPNDMKTV